MNQLIFLNNKKGFDSIYMNEIKNNKELIISNINDYIMSSVGSIVLQNDSIETYPVYLNCFDILIVSLCGMLEQKYRALSYVKADIDLTEKYDLYRKPHNISVEFNELISDYKCEFSESINRISDTLKMKNTDEKVSYDDYLYSTAESIFDLYKIKYQKNSLKKYGYKEFRKIVLDITNQNKNSSINNEDVIVYKLHSDFKNVLDFLDNIKEAYELNVKLGNIYSKFEKGILYSKINKFRKNKNEYSGIYNILLDTYRYAYKYRHAIAHNIKFGYKVNSLDFNSLMTISSNDNIFEFLYAIMVADKIIINIYNHIEMRSMI